MILARNFAILCISRSTTDLVKANNLVQAEGQMRMTRSHNLRSR